MQVGRRDKSSDSELYILSWVPPPLMPAARSGAAASGDCLSWTSTREVIGNLKHLGGSLSDFPVVLVPKKKWWQLWKR